MVFGCRSRGPLRPALNIGELAACQPPFLGTLACDEFYDTLTATATETGSKAPTGSGPGTRCGPQSLTSFAPYGPCLRKSPIFGISERLWRFDDSSERRRRSEMSRELRSLGPLRPGSLSRSTLSVPPDVVSSVSVAYLNTAPLDTTRHFPPHLRTVLIWQHRHDVRFFAPVAA